MMSGGQCVTTAGAPQMQVWSADNWDMHTLEVRTDICTMSASSLIILINFTIQLPKHTAVLGLVLVWAPSF